jgi:aminopeptidase-like protein
MKPYSSLKSILSEFYPLHRTLASDDQDKTLEIIGSYMPDNSSYTIETYAPLSPAWTWKVPERYVVNEAYLEIEGGERVVDFKNNPLHIVSYSLPVDKTLKWDELQPHLHFNEKRPHTIPWVFKYYDRDWGFCLPKNTYDKLPRDRKYRVVIRSEFVTDPKQGFKVASAVIHPEGGPNPAAGEFIVQAHTCHPMQANDDGAGVVSTIELARRLAGNLLPAGSMSVRFWFGPETIGTIVYLSHNESIIQNLRGGIFMEMTGNKNKLAFHRSRQDHHLLDRITKSVFESRGQPYEEREFAAAPANDERVINGPGVNVPCISINRWPYDEYHTTDDNLDIMHDDMLVGAAETAEQIIRIYATNYFPRRAFRGPVFLSGNGLWVDWRENWALNRAIEKIMMRFEGQHSVFDIAAQVGLDYWMVRDYVEKFRVKGFVTALPVPSEAQDS